ncbi:MAG: hypothetical protein FWD91_06860, partial [Treponema sp.]|nr:hypothetical protein [Treponema sp.]
MYRKLLVALLLAIFASHLVSAQQSSQAWWYTLEEGKFLLRSGAYGDAFTAFENARRARQTQFTRMEQDFIRVLSIPDVRRLGDSLDFVERYIDARGETSAASALAYLYHHTPRSSFGGSASRALSGFDRLKSFPEAEYWLGETYRAEGELAMSLRHYERALAERELLQTPNFDVEILYRMTDVHRVRQEYQEMERRAGEIISGTNVAGTPRDELWVRGTIRPAMARLLENEGAHRFLSLYRYNNTLTERAHRLLGFYYHATNRLIPAVDHLTFAFLIQNTILIEDILR